MWRRFWRPRDPRIGDELRFHRERLVEDYVAGGIHRGEAERRALLELGNAGAIEEAVRDVRGRRLDDFRTDVRYALRTLRRNPGFAAVVVLTLALGVGANAAVVSIVYGILLKPLPAPEPHQLVNIVSPGPRAGSVDCGTIGRCEAVFSYPMFRDLERVQTAFTGIAAHSAFDVNLTYRGEATRNRGLLVSGRYFPVLGQRPALGRLLGPDDDAAGASHVLVLRHAFWKRHFGGIDVIGDTLTVNGQPMTIVGVAPEEFEGTTVGLKPDVFIPMTMRWRLANDSDMPAADQRRAYWLFLFARLKPGVSIEQARTAIDTPYRAIINETEVALQEGMSDQMLAQFRAKAIRLDPGSRGQSTFAVEARLPLTLLAAFTTLVLIVACLNVANLVLARAAARSKELTTRLSIGATRGRLIAQLMTESSVLAMITAFVSLLVAQWTLNLFRGLLPDPELLPNVETPIPFVAGALAVAASLAVGLFPALQATRADVLSALSHRAGVAPGNRLSRPRRTLATAQVALSMVLVVLAGLFTKSLVNVMGGDPGLKTANVAMFGLVPARNGYTNARSAALFDRVEREIAALPGVSGVSSSTTPILSGQHRVTQGFVEGFDAGLDVDRDTQLDEIGSGYFRTLGIQLIAGREFTAADSAGAPKVVIVNERFARKFGLGSDALGKRMSPRTPALDFEIVGVVKNFKQTNVRDAVEAMYFVPHRQGTRRPGQMVFYVRSSPGALGPTVAGIRQVVRGIDPNLPIEELRTVDETIRGMTTGDRVMSVMTTAFGLLALVIAAIGLYGMLSYMVAQRTPEIGVRMTLGATRREVRWMVFRQVTAIIVAGAAIGLTVALLVGRLAQRILFGLQFHDPIVIFSSLTVLAGVALVAGVVPAHRAASVDPMRALKVD